MAALTDPPPPPAAADDDDDEGEDLPADDLHDLLPDAADLPDEVDLGGADAQRTITRLQQRAARRAIDQATVDGTAPRPAPRPPTSPARRAAQAFGRQGEDLACRLLVELDMEILTRNYHGPHGELDIVARDGCVLCFVEVKTRHHDPRSRPADALTPHKRRALGRTAARYLRELGHPPIPHRFDIIEVIFLGRRLHELRHWPNEFHPREDARKR